LRACQHPNAVHAAVPGMGAVIWQGLFALTCLGQAIHTGPLTCIPTTIRGHRPCATEDVWHATQGGGVRRVAARAAAGDVLHGAAAGRGRAAAGARRHAARQETAALHPGLPYIPTPCLITLPYARRTAYLLSSGRLRTWCEAAWESGVRRMELAMCRAGQPAHAAFGCLSWQRPASNGGATQ